MAESFVNVAGWTAAGNVISFSDTIESEGASAIHYEGVEIFVDYTYTLTTVNPLGGVGDGLIQAMNPVHIIYEALTNREWGRGLPRSRLNDDAWRYAAQKCFTEQFGLCLRWNRTSDIKSFIGTVLDHLGAAMYDNRTTGKVEIRLIRDDYFKANLPLFDKNNGLLEIGDAPVSVFGNMINEVKVVYRDPVTDEDRTVRAVNLAALQASGGAINSVTKQYPGVPTSELANRLAKRDLRAMSPSIRRFSLTFDRRGFDITPGAVLRIQDLSRGIPDMVVRIGTVDYGRIGDGKIQVVALQDVFGMPQRGFTVIGPPTWHPPTSRPCTGPFRAFEMPYRSLYRALSTAEFAYVDPASAYLGVVAQEGQPVNANFTIAVRPGAIESEDEPIDTSYVCGI
jgi:hypothetical protein